MESDEMSPAQAAAQLAALRTDREQLAARVVPPRWYDPALGVVVFAVVASIALRDVGWWQPVVLVLALVALGTLVQAYRRTTGVWVNGLRPGRTRRAIAAWFVLYVAVLGLAFAGDLLLGWRWATVAGGAVLGVGVWSLSRWWTRLYVAELREGA
jgi:uncharacterized membrane protein